MARRLRSPQTLPFPEKRPCDTRHAGIEKAQERTFWNSACPPFQAGPACGLVPQRAPWVTVTSRQLGIKTEAGEIQASRKRGKRGEERPVAAPVGAIVGARASTVRGLPPRVLDGPTWTPAFPTAHRLHEPPRNSDPPPQPEGVVLGGGQKRGEGGCCRGPPLPKGSHPCPAGPTSTAAPTSPRGPILFLLSSLHLEFSPSVSWAQSVK